MTKLIKTSALKTSAMAIALFSIAACSGDPEAPESDTVTETRMDEVDVLDGTISDDMLNVDAQETTDDMLNSDRADAKNSKEEDTAEKTASDEDAGNSEG
ncbi:hypothetical protein AB1K62_04755 [Parasphingorhabdus sp. JC815]|uniref:hypothetical protein n=1 Tax=Parasphingorhabdus sp. JC815 TaxID=3232140 RepID=UPI0034585C4A